MAWRRVRATALARLGRLAEAERLGREAVEIAAATDYTDLHADALAGLGEVLRLADRLPESAAALEHAITLFEAKRNLVAAQRACAFLAGSTVEV